MNEAGVCCLVKEKCCTSNLKYFYLMGENRLKDYSQYMDEISQECDHRLLI